MQCTAKCKSTGNQCRRAAIKGKDKCYVHGGMTPIKHGFYSKYAPHFLKEKIKQAEKVKMKDKLEGAINLYSAMLADYFQEKHTNTIIDIQLASIILEKLVNAVYKYEKIDKEIGKPVKFEGEIEHKASFKADEGLDEIIANHFTAYLKGHSEGSKTSDNGEGKTAKDKKKAVNRSRKSL